jgi:uncharacterized protein YegL
MAEQIPFGSDIVETATNPEPRCPCVLLLDVSASMAGQRIATLNEGLQAYRNGLISDTLASQRVEVAVVTFGGEVQTVCQFTTADRFEPPNLTVRGQTPMGAALRQGVAMVRERKQFLRQQGLEVFRPWIWLVSDGEPTDGDEWRNAAEEIKQGEAAKAFAFFAVGVEDANMEILRQISVRPPLTLKGLQFREMFVWLSQSQRSVSHSRPGAEDQVGFSNPTAPTGWASL